MTSPPDHNKHTLYSTYFFLAIDVQFASGAGIGSVGGGKRGMVEGKRRSEEEWPASGALSFFLGDKLAIVGGKLTPSNNTFPQQSRRNTR